MHNMVCFCQVGFRKRKGHGVVQTLGWEPADSSWSCGEGEGEGALGPASGAGAPASAAPPSPPLPPHLSAGVPLANVLVFVVHVVPAALPGDGRTRQLPLMPPSSAQRPARPQQGRDLQWRRAGVLICAGATCKRGERAVSGGSAHQATHQAAPSRGALPSASPAAMWGPARPRPRTLT